MERPGYEAASERIGRELSKWIASLQGIRTPVLESRPMEAVAARPRLSCYQPGDGFTEFGVVVLRGDLHFGHGVEVWIDYRNSDDWILVVGSVQFVTGGKWQLPIHLDLLAALWVLRFADVPSDISGAGR